MTFQVFPEPDERLPRQPRFDLRRVLLAFALLLFFLAATSAIALA